MRIKETLNLGKTDFPMRGNLPVKELERQNIWAENKVYEQRQKLNEGKPTYVLHDGPPYANGNIHIGHALNKITKDVIVRYKSMSGFRAPYVPGWDTHGLPIEQQLTKEGHDRKKMTKSEFRDLCHKYALEQVDKQRDGFKRLGVAGEWDNPYLTLQKEYEAAQIRVFGEFAKKDLLYRGKKPVYWSWSSESALAEAEVDYHDVVSPSAFYGERVMDGKGVLDTDTYMVVWTTTPWTIPGSEGITIDAKFDYLVVTHDGDTSKKFVIAADLINKCAELFEWSDVETVKVVKGAELENVTAEHPFFAGKELITMLGDFVTTDAGTGLVHTAPGYGDDDYNIGRKYGLDVFAPVDDRGYLTAEAGPDFDGVFYEEANQIALDKLKDAGLLLKHMPYEHSYPFDWRTKKPIIFRATDQWFASVDKIRSQILAAIDDVTFSPDWGKVRLHNMIRDRGDWVISRQRVWGVPIPVFYAEDGTPIIEPETINHVADLFGEFGSNVWFDREAKELLPDGYTNEHSPNGIFKKETDIMDVWFDSGTSHQGVLAERDNLTYPADLYMEGSDQYRGWFNSSLITSVVMSGKAPYKAVMSQGFTLDSDGRKMSKSIGNTIDPSKVIKQMGAEIIRLWVLSVDSSSDVRVSMEGMKQVSESYRKIRNTMRFLMANTTDFDQKTDGVAYDDLESIDQYMLIRLNSFVEEIRGHYEKNEFLDIYKKLMNFVTTELSAFYMNVAKDVVYIDAENSKTRRSMQTVFYKILVSFSQLLTPVLPHTTEEIWGFLKEDEEFVQLSEMPEVTHYSNETAVIENWNSFMNLRGHVLKVLEEARDAKEIGKSLEARLDLYVSESNMKMLEDLDANVQQMLEVSDLHIQAIDDAPSESTNFNDGVALVASPAEGEVCQRCRMTSTDVGSDDAYPELCARCAAIVRAEYPETITEGLEK